MVCYDMVHCTVISFQFELRRVALQPELIYKGPSTKSIKTYKDVIEKLKTINLKSTKYRSIATKELHKAKNIRRNKINNEFFEAMQGRCLLGLLRRSFHIFAPQYGKLLCPLQDVAQYNTFTQYIA